MTSFTVIGIFETNGQAQKACAEIQSLFENIQDARQAVQYRRHHYTTPTWAEGVVSEKYGLEWNESLDWIVEISRQVSQFLNYVFVTNDLARTYQYPNSLADLLEKLASRVLVEGSLEGRRGEHIVLAKIDCLAPERLVATHIAEELNLYLEAKIVDITIPPWEIFSPVLELSHQDLLKKPYGVEIDRSSVQQAVRALYRYQKAQLQNRPLAKFEGEAINALYALKQQGYTLPESLDAERLQRIIQWTGGTSDSAMGKTVQVTGQKIHMPEIFPFSPASGIFAIHRYLENEGCTDIEWSLKTVPYASKREYI